MGGGEDGGEEGLWAEPAPESEPEPGLQPGPQPEPTFSCRAAVARVRATVARAQAERAAQEHATEADEGGEGGASERCFVCDARRRLDRRLLLCYGAKAAGEAVGRAEVGHAVCQPCLERWFQKQQDFRAEQRLPPSRRRVCPYCHTELRAVRGGQRGEARYAMGLLKAEGTWPDTEDSDPHS